MMILRLDLDSGEMREVDLEELAEALAAGAAEDEPRRSAELTDDSEVRITLREYKNLKKTSFDLKVKMAKQSEEISGLHKELREARTYSARRWHALRQTRDEVYELANKIQKDYLVQN